MVSVRSGGRNWKPRLPALLLRIDERVERRLAGERSEIRILPGDQAIARLQFDGALQVLLGAGQIAR
jgi:hypothetical protein